jgi:ATP-dependent helicase/nuclease subunit B
MSPIASTLSPIRREFLGWDRPALPEAARRLGDRYRHGQTLDLGRVIVVVPGQRAGRRLQELLAFLAEDEHLRLTPPQVVTEGKLPEKLYTAKQPFADDIVQDLAWAQALRGLPTEKRKHVVPHPPAAAEVARWLELGRVLRDLHRELAADGLDFGAVTAKGPQLPDFTDAQRWQALVTLQRAYHDLLDEQKLWDIQTARLKAIEFREIRTEADIVLLGTVDLNNTLRQMLDQVAARVTAFIVAPDNLAARFDGHGCLVPSTWCDAPIPLEGQHLRQVDGPLEQADGVTGWLAELGGAYCKDEIAIGVPDESLVPQLQRQLEQCDVRARWVEGVRLGETAPYRLLAAAVLFAGRRRYHDLAGLLRHPDVEDWLAKQTPSRAGDAMSLAAQLDRFYNDHLPSRIHAAQPFLDGPDWPDLTPVLAQIEGWLQEASARYPLRSWGGIFRNILGAVYGDRTLHLDEPADEDLHRTLCKILAECDRLGTLPEALDTQSLPAADAFQVALGPLAREALPPPADPDAVEILGWLELPLDDARALVVTSFNEGFVPQSTGADAFLPDRLRRELGLLHNERRYARDAYATSVLCQSREKLRVLFARRDADNNPLQPSRLVFACQDDALINRARQFFGGQKTPATPRRLLLAANVPIGEKSRFEVPIPVVPQQKLERISVTRFKDYLACPYRYYLRHVCKLEAVDDAAGELDGRTFGILLHGALSALGRNGDSPGRSAKEREIFEFLDEHLHAFAKERYGASQRRAAVRLQLEQARLRLKAFAVKQAEVVQEGWCIVYAENAENTGAEWRAPFPVDGAAIDLTGRIDRIDFHEAKRTLRVLDYKTADKAQTPDEAHRNKNGWIDLQLPLYRYLRHGTKLPVPATCAIELGYFNLPKQPGETAVALAPWDDATLADADNAARQVVRRMRGTLKDLLPFWPPVYPAPDFSDDFSAICLDNVFSSPASREDDEGGDP